MDNNNQFLGMTLKDAEYIKDAITISYEDDNAPVSTQKSIKDMYNNRVICNTSQYDLIDAVVFDTNTHVTWLREKISDKVPRPRVKRALTLKLDSQITWELYTACG